MHLKKFGSVIYALKKIRFDYLCTYKYIDLFVCEHWLDLYLNFHAMPDNEM